MALTGTATPGGIGQRQIALRRHGLCRVDFELAGPAAGVEIQRLLIGDLRNRAI
jgi:hypothetical protein